MTTSVSQLLDEGSTRLGRVTDQPRREAEILLAAALERPRAWLLAHRDQDILDCDATDRYEALVTRRSHGEPVAYVLGEKEFWSLRLTVTHDVLIPRPETELLVERALALIPGHRDARVLDLGTGSGAIALAIASERPRWRVLGTDVSATACALAQRNAARLGLANVAIRAGSWYEPLANDECFDLIVCNPPYIAVGDQRIEPGVRRYEPPGALYAGHDGLDALRVVIDAAPRYLVTTGWLLVEHGDRQGDDVRKLCAHAGFARVSTWRDLAGAERCTAGARNDRR